jgi:MoaA/NifB/PqqE/SkfB family radical SAM enzyme
MEMELQTRPPIQISFRITNACNHRCDVCGQYGKKGYMIKDHKKSDELLKTLPIESYKKVMMRWQNTIQ